MLRASMTLLSRMVDPVVVGSLKGAKDQFKKDGFVVLDSIISCDVCNQLNQRIEAVLRGNYDKEGGAPDKSPKFSADDRVKKGKTPPALGGPSSRTLQVINIWKAFTPDVD